MRFVSNTWLTYFSPGLLLVSFGSEAHPCSPTRSLRFRPDHLPLPSLSPILNCELSAYRMEGCRSELQRERKRYYPGSLRRCPHEAPLDCYWAMDAFLRERGTRPAAVHVGGGARPAVFHLGIRPGLQHSTRRSGMGLLLAKGGRPAAGTNEAGPTLL